VAVGLLLDRDHLAGLGECRQHRPEAGLGGRHRAVQQDQRVPGTPLVIPAAYPGEIDVGRHAGM
jgi:hypothetical protein